MIEQAQNDIDKRWTDLIWTLSENDMNNFNAFKASDTFDFFMILKANEAKYKKNGRV